MLRAFLCYLVVFLECEGIFSLQNSEINEKIMFSEFLDDPRISRVRSKRQMGGGFPGGFQFAQGAGQRQFGCCQKANNQMSPDIDETMIKAKYECRQKVEIAIYQASRQNGVDNIQSNPNTIPFEFVKRWRSAVVCTMDCVGDKYNLVNEAGNLNVNEIKGFVKQNFIKEDWELANYEKWIDDCKSEVQTGNHQTLDVYGMKCNTQLSAMSMCLWRARFINCPADKQSNSRICAMARYLINSTQVPLPNF